MRSDPGPVGPTAKRVWVFIGMHTQVRPMPSRYETLFSDAQVRRWYEDVSRGSPITADVYLKRLGWFCGEKGLTPAELATLEARSLQDLLLDMVTALEQRGLAGGSIALSVKALKSWAMFNGTELKGRIRIRRRYETPTLQHERVPSQEELKGIFLAANQKARTICALMAHSGLRPMVLGNYRGTDGLRISDLPELTVENGQVSFAKVPALVRVRSSLSKAGHEYFTFLGKEGCDAVKAYLESRIRAGEPISGASALVKPKVVRKQFISTINIGDAVRNSLRNAGFRWRPYVLRSYFATQMMLAESKGLIIRDYRSFFMGHKGDIEHVYTLNKKNLPPDVVEEMRSGYARAFRYLETSRPAGGEEDGAKALRRQFLLMAGFNAESITEEQLTLEDDAFHKVIRDRFFGTKPPGMSQRVVAASEIDCRLREGWEFVSLLADGSAILKCRDGA